VAPNPHGSFHFHTGRPLAARLGDEPVIVDGLPDAAVESFAGVANPLALRPLVEGERVVDVGSGAGFDCFVAAHHVPIKAPTASFVCCGKCLKSSPNSETPAPEQGKAPSMTDFSAAC
jgi:hypothetical protein